MNFLYYPFDSHALPLQIELFGNPNSDVTFVPTSSALVEPASVASSLWKLVRSSSKVQPIAKATGLTYDRFVVHM